MAPKQGIKRIIDIVIIHISYIKEPGESINKDLKSFQLDHAPQFSPTERLTAAFDRIMDRSDPEVLRHFNKGPSIYYVKMILGFF